MHYTLAAIREAGCTAGAALCPATPCGALDEVAAFTLDLALCMSVDPGWGSQPMIPGSYDKLARMRDALARPRRARGRRRRSPRDRGAVRAGRGQPARRRLGGVRLLRPGAAYQSLLAAASTEIDGDRA